MDKENAEVNALADELYTVATTTTEHQARGLSGGLRPAAMLALALAGLVFAVIAGTLAWAESGPAIVAAWAPVLPAPFVRRFLDAETGVQPSGPRPVALPVEGGDAHPPARNSSRTEAAQGELDSAGYGGPVRPLFPLRDAEGEAGDSAFRTLEELGPQPARSLSFADDGTERDQPESAEPADEPPPPLWRPKALQRPAADPAA
jgi:hypothetical protein